MRRARLGLLPLVVWGLSAQNTGRFAAQTSRGIELIGQGRFNEAVNVLEEVWEHDHSDPAVPEHLAMGYLYADRNASRAKELMEAAIALGGRATLLMQHAHERVTPLSAGTSDYCLGRLSIDRDHMAFTAAQPGHSFTIRVGEFREIKKNRWFGRSEAVYHITTRDKRTFNLRPRTWSERETELVLFLIDKYIQR